MSGQIPSEALIHDMAIVLAGSLHPAAQIGPAPRLAARRMAGVLGVGDGETVKSIENRLGEALRAPLVAADDSTAEDPRP